MHEMSIVTSILTLVEEEMRKHNVTRLHKVGVRCGELSNVVPEAMTFAFEALTVNSPMEGAVLEIERMPLTLQCHVCQHTFAPKERMLIASPCPLCHETLGHEVVSGRELHLQYIEADHE